MYTVFPFWAENKFWTKGKNTLKNRSLLCQLQLAKKVEDKKGIQMLTFLAVKKQLTRL